MGTEDFDIITVKDLENFGFLNVMNNFWRKHYRAFVVDIYPTTILYCWNVEFSTQATTIKGKVNSFSELTILLAIFNRYPYNFWDENEQTV